MQNFMLTLLICSVTMSVLAITYMAVTPFLARRYSPKYRYYAWLIIVIGLIIPFRPQFNNPFIKIMPADAAMPIIQLGNGTQPVNLIANSLPHAASPYISLNWWQIGASIWFIGMVVFLICHLVKHCRFMKMVNRWSEVIADEVTLEILKSVASELDILGDISLHQCPGVGTPMLTGFIKPRILLPHTAFAKEDLRLILHHELVHYKRKDLWYKCLVLFATAIHWFNPFMRLIAREIDMQCEISCDSEVMNRADADTRQQYCEAIIGVIIYQSRMKSPLSTNFYGGKKGMKKRIFSIIDTRNKKAGAIILCSVLIFTLGTGYAFAAKENTGNQPEYVKEDFVVSPGYGYHYKFLPSPDIYAKYSSYGIEISENGEQLLYHGQKVRLFADDHSDTESFYYDQAGTVDLSVARNSSGDITGMNTISSKDAQKYYSAFFEEDIKADDIKNESNPSGTKYEQYSAYGITYSEEKNSLYFNGQKVRLLVDKNDGEFYTFWFDEKGTVDLSAVRNSAGQITDVQTISKENAQAYMTEANKKEQAAQNRLEKKVEEKMKQLYRD